VLVSDAPGEIIRKRGAATLEDAFIAYLEDAGAKGEQTKSILSSGAGVAKPATAPSARFSFARAWSYTMREALELKRDPVRATLALAGSLILMFVMGYGINMDVENLRFAILDRDQTTLSQNYALHLAGSRYFVERPPIT